MISIDFNGRLCWQNWVPVLFLGRCFFCQLRGARILCDLAEILQGCHSHRACHWVPPSATGLTGPQSTQQISTDLNRSQISTGHCDSVQIHCGLLIWRFSHHLDDHFGTNRTEASLLRSCDPIDGPSVQRPRGERQELMGLWAIGSTSGWHQLRNFVAGSVVGVFHRLQHS